MSQSVCLNPECGKTYNVVNINTDDGCCSFECWEKVNCREPNHAHFEEIQLGA